MKRTVLALAIAALAGCAESTEPSQVYPSYNLGTVNGQQLPVPYGDGSSLVSNVLIFDGTGRPRDGAAVEGLVRYVLDIRRADQSLEHSEIELDYRISGDELRINLCPPLALCITTTELVGTIEGRTDPLVLTHYVGGLSTGVYRYFPALPD